MANINLLPWREERRQELKQEFPEDKLNKNVRDVLTHLHHWHLMLLEWHSIGMKGKKPDMPAKGYTWRTLPDLNRKIWEHYQTTSIQESQQLLNSSYSNIQQLIQDHTDEELFEKKRYAWTGSTSLGAYLISNTCSHYHWAIKLIKKSKKSKK